MARLRLLPHSGSDRLPGPRIVPRATERRQRVPGSASVPEAIVSRIRGARRDLSATVQLQAGRHQHKLQLNGLFTALNPCLTGRALVKSLPLTPRRVRSARPGARASVWVRVASSLSVSEGHATPIGPAQLIATVPPDDSGSPIAPTLRPTRHPFSPSRSRGVPPPCGYSRSFERPSPYWKVPRPQPVSVPVHAW